MRIAQIAPLYESVPPSLYGGTERVVSWLTEELTRLGHEVTLFASGDSKTEAKLVAVCAKALRLDEHCKDPLPHHILMMSEVFSQGESFDLIHSHVDYIHFPLARTTATPCITTLHGRLDIPDLVPLYQYFREQPLVSISYAQRSPLSWANWQGTVAHGMPRNLLKFGNGEGKYLAFLGRVSPEKGLDEAIRIARRSGMLLRIAAKIDPADRVFYEERIKPMLASEVVEFIGEIGSDEKSKFLGDAAALLFPVNWPEPFGLVMIESLACGTPVIAYRCGSVPEIVEHGTTGFIVSDIDSAVNGVQRIGEIDRRMCRKRFEQRFSDERMARDYLSIYQRLVRRKLNSLALADGALSWTDLVPNTTT